MVPESKVIGEDQDETIGEAKVGKKRRRDNAGGPPGERQNKRLKKNEGSSNMVVTTGAALNEELTVDQADLPNEE